MRWQISALSQIPNPIRMILLEEVIFGRSHLLEEVIFCAKIKS